MFVIGGDISNHYNKTLDFVEKLQQITKVPVYFIPGNHDFWSNKDSIDTWQIYEKYRKHPQSLLESPIVINDEYAIVGHCAWYNYWIYDKKIDYKKVSSGTYRWATWQDKKKINWGKSDPEVSKIFAHYIQEDLEKVKNYKIILVTHMVTISEFTVPMPNRLFDFFNAYIATSDLLSFYKEYPIKYSFMGHVHFRGKIKKDNTIFITNSLGYRREWLSKDKNLEKELEQSIYILKL